MLSKQDNETLVRIGAGTEMGELMRRFWMPALLSSELPEPDGAPVRIRLMGEDLVAFRDTAGRVGLLEEHCPHRGTSLSLGTTSSDWMIFGSSPIIGVKVVRCVMHSRRTARR